MGIFITQEQLPEIVNSLRAQGLSIVVTNGCFDILHAGHVRYLTKTKTGGCLPKRYLRK